MVSKFFYIIFIVAFFCELVLTSIPLILIMLLNLFIFSKKEWVFILAFIVGILFDILALRPIGFSSIFYISSLFLISLYERKFETTTIYFVFIMSVILSAIYLVLFSRFSILESIFSGVLGALVFLFLNYLKHKTLSLSTKNKKMQYRGIV
ncbi:MAG TPA: hypothetical protein VFD45_03050 [Patescibacteria group bacterium]|nr:hypothetical protein [Patescibacteria group bacterium]